MLCYSTEMDVPDRYYQLKDNEKNEIYPNVNNFFTSFEFDNEKIDIDYSLVTIEGKNHLFQNSIDKYGNHEKSYSSNNIINNELIWIRNGKTIDDYGNYCDYYILYNIKTNEISDVLKEVLPKNINIETIVLSPDKTKLLLTEFSGGGFSNYYYFDLLTNQFICVNDFGFKNFDFCYYINDETLVVAESEDATLFSNVKVAYSFNVKTKETKIIFENADKNNKTIYLPGGFFIQKKLTDYSLILPTWNFYKIEGLDSSINYDFLMNLECQKIAILKKGETNTIELGMVDITKKEIKLFDREDFSGNSESSVSWINENDLSFLLKNDNVYMHYIYRFR